MDNSRPLLVLAVQWVLVLRIWKNVFHKQYSRFFCFTGFLRSQLEAPPDLHPGYPHASSYEIICAGIVQKCMFNFWVRNSKTGAVFLEGLCDLHEFDIFIMKSSRKDFVPFKVNQWYKNANVPMILNEKEWGRCQMRIRISKEQAWSTPDRS